MVITNNLVKSIVHAQDLLSVAGDVKRSQMKKEKVLFHMEYHNFEIGSYCTPPFPPFNSNFEKLLQHCHNAMKLDMANKLTIVNRFVIHTLDHNNITHSVILTCKSTI